MKVPQPMLVVRGSLSKPKDVFLVVEKNLLCKITNIKMGYLILLAGFFVFNMQYTTTLVNVYTFLECFFLDLKVPKGKSRINSFMAQLHNTL